MILDQVLLATAARVAGLPGAEEYHAARRKKVLQFFFFNPAERAGKQDHIRD